MHQNRSTKFGGPLGVSTFGNLWISLLCTIYPLVHGPWLINRWCSHFNLDRRFPSHVSLPESEATLILSLPMCLACPDRGNAAISACEEFGRWAEALHLLSVAESMELQWKHIIHGWNIDLILRCHQTWLGNPYCNGHWDGKIIELNGSFTIAMFDWYLGELRMQQLVNIYIYLLHLGAQLFNFGLCYDWFFMDM